MTEDMGLALQNHQLEADNERLTGQNAALREENRQLDQRCVDLYRQLTQVTAERHTLVADVRQRQAGQKSAEEQLAHVRKENTAMRALLERVVTVDPEWIVDGNPCLFCDANAPGGEVIHAQDCLIVQARALLAKT